MPIIIQNITLSSIQTTIIESREASSQGRERVGILLSKVSRLLPCRQKKTSQPVGSDPYAGRPPMDMPELLYEMDRGLEENR